MPRPAGALRRDSYGWHSSSAEAQCIMMPCLGTNTYRRNARVEIARLVVAVVILFQRCLAADPQPISVATTTDFFGYDGQWSAVTIRVGTPEQWLSAFPSTLSQETWVIGPDGCDGTDICQQKRGGLFFANESSSFVSRGFYELGFDTQLGGTGDGDYGLDTLALDDAVSAPDQIVAIINSTEYWLGQFGLGVQQTRFNGTQDYLPFLSSLVQNESLIPSHSYGYTAGAYYRKCGWLRAGYRTLALTRDRFKNGSRVLDSGRRRRQSLYAQQYDLHPGPGVCARAGHQLDLGLFGRFR